METKQRIERKLSDIGLREVTEDGYVKEYFSIDVTKMDAGEFINRYVDGGCFVTDMKQIGTNTILITMLIPMANE